MMAQEAGRQGGATQQSGKTEQSGRRFGTIGLVGRFKPLHNGGASLLEAACASAERVIIGIGSCNPEKYGLRNPFTPEETKGMIDAYLAPRFANYEVAFLQDYGHIPEFRDGQRWRKQVLDEYGALDAFVSGNAYVQELLKDDYTFLHPYELITHQDQVHDLCATDVRKAMAAGEGWERLVPKEVASYLRERGLVERFRREFGDATLASARRAVTAEEERSHVAA